MNFDTLDMDVNIILGKHFTSGRQGNEVEGLGNHYNAGNLTCEQCYNTWNGSREASAHVQVESNGRTGQFVWDRDTAWALNNFPANLRTINIEHANLADGTITETCLDTGAHIVAAYCKQFGLGRPEWLKNVFPHKYFSSTSCPGEIYGSQRDAYIQRAQYWYDVMTGTVEPEPEEPETPLPAVLRRFTDLDPESWYIGAIEECVREGYINGYDQSHFGPTNSLTRGEAVCVISNAARADLSTYLEPFKDVAPSPFYYTAVCWAVDEGIVAQQDNFRPNDPCTRAELLCMLHNWQGNPVAGHDPEGYADWGEVPEFAQSAIAWAVERGVISGIDGRLSPNTPCSRAEAAAMLANLL